MDAVSTNPDPALEQEYPRDTLVGLKSKNTSPCSDSQVLPTGCMSYVCIPRLVNPVERAPGWKALCWRLLFLDVVSKPIPALKHENPGGIDVGRKC